MASGPDFGCRTVDLGTLRRDFKASFRPEMTVPDERKMNRAFGQRSGEVG
jgi:hypothetical protein